MDIFGLLKNIVTQPKSSAQGIVGIVGAVLSLWFQPAYAAEIVAAVLTLWGAGKMIGRDKN